MSKAWFVLSNYLMHKNTTVTLINSHIDSSKYLIINLKLKAKTLENKIKKNTDLIKEVIN